MTERTLFYAIDAIPFAPLPGKCDLIPLVPHNAAIIAIRAKYSIILPIIKDKHPEPLLFMFQ